MKLFSRVFRPARNGTKKKKASSNSSDRKVLSKNAGSGADDKSTATKSTQPSEAPSTELTKVQIAENFMEIAARHDSEELLAAFSSPRARIHLEDGFSMSADSFCGALKHMWDAFPDHKFRYETVFTKDGGNAVVIDGLVSSATHTGVPYTIGEKYPAIPAAGKYVINDEERFLFTFAKNGKLASMSVISFGNVTGPAGFYEQIGGKL